MPAHHEAGPAVGSRRHVAGDRWAPETGRHRPPRSNPFERNEMKAIDIVMAVLVIVGGLNWGLVAIANFDLVAFLTQAGGFGAKNALGALIYGLVGLAAVYQLFKLRSVPSPR
jgi:uncharacterized membrane protein YuzA (DUF378 family)